MAAEQDLGPGESPSVNARAVLLVTAGILALLVAIAFGLEVFFHDRVGRTFVALHPLPPPGVSPSERALRIELETKQRAALNGAGGRMPIDDAMQAIAAKGPHAFDPIEVSR
jgi:hypothetical protein